jgi:cell division protein FtsB
MNNSQRNCANWENFKARYYRLCYIAIFDWPMKFAFQLPQSWFLYLLAFGISLLCFVTMIGDRGVFHLWRLKGEKRRLDEQNYRLQKENESLRRRISRLRHDDTYLEKFAREELNLVRPGEIIYRFAPSEPKTGLGSPSGTPPERRPSAAQREHQ